jgi:hypothetical protein
LFCLFTYFCYPLCLLENEGSMVENGSCVSFFDMAKIKSLVHTHNEIVSFTVIYMFICIQSGIFPISVVGHLKVLF